MFIIILAQHKQCYTEKNKLTTSTVLSVRDVIQNEIVECGIKYNFSLFCPHRPHVLLVYASLGCPRRRVFPFGRLFLRVQSFSNYNMDEDVTPLKK